ncbi:NPCBM-associated, NEW3 domain of alpha-galactosidase family protein [Mycobacterium xenopi 4042]|uniref:NPCBM-associated, NEW3 domain of alpha-galactosidase family protein n=1 Tax=Mycobacterium xenopi 4042 TaxID=1299334 RepID=X7YIG9_MYCXE|nr:NPCBM-associated, NEW3 domain of alpha-galactosidase family protein [Mycobacterium xenopi 4042]
MFTKAVLATAHPPTAPNSTVSSSRPAGQGVGARRRAAGHGLGARRRPARATALPVLVIAGRDDSDLAAAVAALTDDLADAEVVVSQQVPASCRRSRRERWRCSTAGAQLRRRHRRHPAHRADALLHRLAVGYLDRRAAPQRARRLGLPTPALDPRLRLRAGRRPRRLATRRPPAAARSSPIRCSPCRPARAPAGSRDRVAAARRTGGRGATRRAESRRQPAGPRAGKAVDPAVVAMRLVETHGSDTGVRVGSTLGTVSGVCSADLLEDRRPHQPASVLHGYQIATLTARLEMPQVLDAQAALGPEAEAAQPLYARYWLHNRGPAPLGGLPAVAYLHPHTVAAEPGSEVVLRLTVASDCTDTEVRGTLTLVCPHGWVAGPASCR